MLTQLISTICFTLVVDNAMLLELGLFVKLIGMIGIFILTRSCRAGDENLQLYMKIRIFLLLLHLHMHVYVQKPDLICS